MELPDGWTRTVAVVAGGALLVASLATNVFLNVNLHAESKTKDATISLLEQQNMHISRSVSMRAELMRPKPPVTIYPTLQSCSPYIRARMGLAPQGPNSTFSPPSPHQHIQP